MSDVSANTPIRIGIDGRILMHYEMRGFARYTVELFRAMQEIAGNNIELSSFSPGPIASQFLAELIRSQCRTTARTAVIERLIGSGLILGCSICP